MADEDKKGAGTSDPNEVEEQDGDFKDIGSMAESDWEGALDEWDTTFEGLDDAKEPSQPVKLPEAKDAPAEASAPAVGAEEPSAEKPAEAEVAAPKDIDLAFEAEPGSDRGTADLTPPKAEEAAAEEPAAEELAAEEPAAEKPAAEEAEGDKKADELDFLTSGEFDFEMETGEALGEMLGSDLESDMAPATSSRPSLEGLVDMAPEATEEVSLPPAPSDSQVFDFRDKVKGVADKSEEPKIADMEMLRDASERLAQKNAEAAASEFDESTRMVAADDQLRLAQEAMEHKADEELGLEFEESTRLVSAADQMRMASESVHTPDQEQAQQEEQEEQEVTLTVDDEFYDDFSIEDQDGAPPEELDFGEPEQDSATDGEPSVGEDSPDAVPVDPRTSEVTPARPHMAVPPDARRDDDEATPVPGEDPVAAAAAEGEVTPIPSEDPVTSAEEDLDAALDALADQIDHPVEDAAEPELPPEAVDSDSDVYARELDFEPELSREINVEELSFGTEEPSGEAEAEELSFEAEEPSGEMDTPELSFEAEEPSGEMDTPELSFDDEDSEVGASDEDERLSSLDAMLGLSSDEPEKTAEAEPKAEAELASLDALLGIADSSPEPGKAEAEAAQPELTDTPSDRVTDFGFDLPEPPAERKFADLSELAAAESHPSSLPELEDLDALADRPTIDGFPETLEPAPQSAQQWVNIVELIVGQVEGESDSLMAATLHTAAGELLEFRLQRDEEALARYYEAATLEAKHRGSRRALLRCALATEDWGGALEALEVLRESESSAEKGAYEALAADLALITMGDAERAAVAYSDLVDHPSLSVSGLLGLVDVAVFNGDPEVLASSLRRLVELIPSEDVVAPVALEAARRLEAQEDDEAAAAAYERATSANDEMAIAAREGLARLAIREGQWDVAAERLRSLVTQIDPGGQRTDAAVSLGRILARRLDRLDEAVSTADGVAREDPERLAVQIRLARLCQEAGQWEKAVDAWKAAGEAAHDDHLKGVAQLWAGLLREQHLSDSEGALECFRAAHEQDASLAAASLAVGDMLGRSEDAEARIEARLAQAAAATEPANQAAQQQLAAREMLLADRPQEALQLLASARASGLDFRGLLSNLVQLSMAQGDTDQACDVLLQLGEQVEPEAAIAARTRAASLVARGLSEGRQSPYQEVYALDGTLGHLAWGAQRALRAAGLDEQWDQAVVTEAESSADAQRGARLWRHLGLARQWRGAEASEAAAAFEHATALSSTDAITREALADQCAAEQQWEECARLLGEAAESSSSSTRSALLQLRRAACLEQRLDAAEQAAELYQELGEQFATWPLPLDTLVRLRVWSGDRMQTAEILKTRADQAATDAERVGLLIRQAAELDFGGDVEAAAQVLRGVLGLAPQNPVAKAAYLHVENELGNWAVLADRALTLAKDAEDDAARVVAYEELARIDRDGRQEYGSAVLGYESIVRMAPDHHPSLRELELYYPGEQRFNDLGTICAKIADATEGSERAANALEWARFRQAASQREELVEALRTAVRAAPESLYALARLEGHALEHGWSGELAGIHRAVAELYRKSPVARAVFLRRAAESHEADGAPELAVEALTEAATVAPSYLPAAEERLRLELVSEQWPGVAVAAEALAQALRRPEAKAEASLLAGAVAEERLDDAGRAIHNFEAVLELQPANPTAFARLRNLYEQGQSWQELARLINTRLDVADSARTTCALLWDLARVEREQLGDADAAKVTLKRLIGLDGNHLDAVRLAAELYATDEQWVEMADMLIRQARLEKEPQKLAEIFFQLGLLYDEKIPDAKRAAASFTKVVSINQRDIRALERLSAIHVKNEEWKGALAVTGRLVESETDLDRRIDHLITLSQILEGGYRDPRRAREALLKAVEVDPRSLKAVGELASFYGRQNDRRSLMVHLDRSVTNVRTQLQSDPFQGEAYQSLLKLFEWRRAPDQQACAAAALTTIGEGGKREREILSTMGTSRPRRDALKDPELDEILYPRSVNSGFRHTMRLLGANLGKPYRDDLSTYGAGRGTRVPKSGHPLREVANQIASELGVTGYDLHVVDHRPGVLVVEPYDPPAIIVGSALVESATPTELAFIIGRCMKLIQARMVVPAKLKPEQLHSLVAGIVRQYQPDFEPTEVPPVELLERTKLVAKAIPRKVKSELMPFALGCSGITDFAQLSRDIARVANMSGLLACGDLNAAVSVLLRMAGKTPGKKALSKLAKGNAEIAQLLQFGVSEEYFELRRRVGLASGSGPRF